MTTLCDIEAETLTDANPLTARQAILEGSAPIGTASTMKNTAPPTRIVLTGFMGAGKSTVGRLLAAELGWQFIDVDDAIVAKAGTSIAEVFATSGEFVFRRLETSAIARALGERNAVIALGGGAPEVLANRLLLEQTPQTAIVLLEAPLATLLGRCSAQQDGPVRPNLAIAEERFRYRAPLYRRVARVRIDTEGMTPHLAAQGIRERLGLAL